MMKKIKEEIPRLFDKADKLFAPFRNKVESVQYLSLIHIYSGTDAYKPPADPQSQDALEAWQRRPE